MIDMNWKEHSEYSEKYYTRKLNEIMVYLSYNWAERGWDIKIYPGNDRVAFIPMHWIKDEPLNQTFARANMKVRNFMVEESRKWEYNAHLWTFGTKYLTIDDSDDDEWEYDEEYGEEDYGYSVG